MNRGPLYFLISSVLLIGFFFYVTFSLEFYTVRFPLESPDFAQIIGAIGSLLVTVILVTLYWEQTNIQDRQEKWMAAEHKPLPVVESWRPYGNLIEVELMNYGNGIARNIRVEVLIEPDVNNLPYWADSHRRDVVSLFRPGSMNSSLETERGTAQKFENDEIHRFMEFPIGSTKKDNFLDFTGKLQQRNVRGLSLQLKLNYDFIAEESDSIILFSGFLHLSQPMTVEEAVDHATPNHEDIEAPLPN